MTSLARTFHQGHKYMKTWPKQAILSVVFPENRIIAATNFSIKTIPPIALTGIMTQIYWGDPHLLPQTITFVLFTMTLPLQGLYWLGKRSRTHIPLGLLSWYQQLQEKIAHTGEKPVTSRSHPRYQELAETLAQAFRCLDKSQWCSIV